MELSKKQYLKPVLTDQGPVVSKTMATNKGECWDGNPSSGDDNQKGCEP